MPSQVRPLLAIVPVSFAAEDQLEPLARCLVALYGSVPAGLPIVVAAGADSDPDLLAQVGAAVEELDGELVRSPDAVTAAVNAGLSGARDAGADALLIGQDVELSAPGWLQRLQVRPDTAGRPAAVVAGRLLYPEGLIAHAGLYFSVFFREWLPRYLHAPAELPAALAPRACPVGAGLQLIRLEALERVGVYDPELAVEYAAIDYCLRTFAAGLECVYEPAAIATRLTPPRFDGPAPDEDLARSYLRLREKHGTMDFTPWIPELL
jgi:GT2 family glycosyltransferase